MAHRPHLGVAGLFTDPNPHVAVPEGALDMADEVVIRRVGVVEPRPGFAEGDSFNAAETGLIEVLLGLFSYRDAMIAVGPTDEPSVATIHKHEGTDYAVLTEDDDNLSWNPDALRAVEARGNLYLATTDWPRKLSAVGATQAAYGMGVIPPVLISATATVAPGTGVVGDDEAVSYRMVTKRQDAQGVITYSAPSGRVIARNTSGSAKDVLLAQYVRNGIAWDEDTQTGDKLQIYRTEPVEFNVDPGDDHFLIVEIPFEGVSGQGTFTDDIATARLGAPLYTNDDQEGPDAANWRPPAAKDLALYQGSLFFANQTDPARITFSVYEELDRSGEVTGVGLRMASVTYTNGSPVISGFSASEIAGIEVGMLIWNADGSMDFDDHPDPILVIDVDVGAGEITVSSDWNGSTGSAPILIADCLALNVGGSVYYYNAATGGGQLLDAINSGLTDPFSGTVYPAAPGLFAAALGITEDYTNGSLAVGFRKYVIEALSTETTFHITATHPDDYNPALGLITDGGTECAAQAHPNRIGWSKTNEPEHYLLASFQDIGHGADLLRALPTRDALWLLKGRGDGIYRLSGAGALSGFRVDLFDSSTYLLHPNLACVLGDVVYAWTNKGLCAISDAGIELLSGPIASDTRALETELDHTAVVPGAFAVANPKAHEVIFGLPALPIGSSQAAGTVYVFNVRTRAITRWFASANTSPWLDEGVSSAVYHLETRALWFGQAARPHVERLESASVVNADDGFDVEVTSLSGTPGATEIDVVIDGGSGWAPALGDLLVNNEDVAAVVIDVTDATHFRVAREDGFATIGEMTAYVAYRSRVRWRGKTADAPFAQKRYQECTVHWEAWLGVYAWLLTLIGPDAQSAELEREMPEFQRDADNVRTRAHRALVPRAVHLLNRLSPRLDVAQADSRWQCSGVTLGYELVSSRVNR